MELLSVNSIAPEKASDSPDLKKLRDTAEHLVGNVFYGTLLKAMRESSLQGKYGHGGRGEEVFNAQLDQVLAERMGKASHGGLADSIYNTMKKQQASRYKNPATETLLEPIR